MTYHKNHNINLALTDPRIAQTYMLESASSFDWERRAQDVRAAHGGRFPLWWSEFTSQAATPTARYGYNW